MDFENAIEAAVKANEVHGTVLMASNTTGDFQYTRNFGTRTLNETQVPQPFDQDTVLILASCAKLVTSVAVLQCVERGLLQLDGDISEVLSDLDKPMVASINEKGEVELNSAKNPITLRKMLSHSSGQTVEYFSPALAKWRADRNEPMTGGTSGPTVETRFNLPLGYEPGTSWAYGSGLDWAGRAVETVTGTTLEEYMREHIWNPLDIKGMTFWLQKHPELVAHKADMGMRDMSTGKVVLDTTTDFLGEVTACFGGMGMYGRPSDYMRILHSLLADDGKLLQPATAAELFKPQLSLQSKEALSNMLNSNILFQHALGRNIPSSGAKDHGLGGILSLDDYPGWRGRNALMWGGVGNTIWFIDRERGLCGMMAAQINPPADQKMVELLGLFEHGIYNRYAAFKAEQEQA